MMESCPYPIEILLPHAGRMLLLDQVTGFTDAAIEAALGIRSDNPFFEADKGVAAHIAIEWMAQACGAFVGLEAMRRHQPVRVGFLLGTRNFRAERDWFRDGESLIVRAELIFRDGETGVFDCTLRSEVRVEATAQLTLHQPADLAAVLARQGISATGLGQR